MNCQLFSIETSHTLVKTSSEDISVYLTLFQLSQCKVLQRWMELQMPFSSSAKKIIYIWSFIWWFIVVTMQFCHTMILVLSIFVRIWYVFLSNKQMLHRIPYPFCLFVFMLPTHLRQVFFGHLQWGKRTQNGNYKLVQEKYVASRCCENDLQLVIQITSEVSWKHNTKTSWKGSWYFYQTVRLHQTAQHPVSLPLLLLNLVKNVWSGNETHRVDSLLFVALFRRQASTYLHTTLMKKYFRVRKKTLSRHQIGQLDEIPFD